MNYPETPASARERMAQRPLRILAADDSAVMRQILRRVFERHAAERDSNLPPMELVDIVGDGISALAEVERLSPDVLLLDLEMPRMNGLEVLDRLRTLAPGLPVIMCSALTERGASSTFDALARGAKDYVMKPTQQADLSTAIDLLSVQLLPKIAVLAGFSKVSGGRAADPPVPAAPRKESAGGESDRIDIVVIGVSTGGPAALEQLLPMLPAQFPVPVLIVQHMPKLFTGVLAERLNKICRGPVAEGRDGGAVTEGMVVLAPGDAHMEVAAGLGSHSQLRLHQGVPLNSCKPSVDYLFQSAARLFGPSTLALVLTGMGSDGLDGARAIRQAGGTVFAQDEASSAVWGMPGRVVREGIAHQTLPLKAMALAVQQRVLGRPAALRSRRLGQAVNSQPNHSGSNREVRHGLL